MKLLADEDRQVADLARQRLVEEGPGLSGWLRRYALSDNPLLRRRAREILGHFAGIEADARMRAFCRRAGDDLDLEEGLLRLAVTRYPDVNAEAYRALLDEWARQIDEWLPTDRGDVDGVLAGIHVVLFQQLGLHGNEENYYEPDNSYLNRVMDRRSGNPITLCALVLMIGKRLTLPFTGIGLPAHFLCRYQTPIREIYLDAFNGGRLLSRTDCISFVNQLGRPFQNEFLHPVSSRQMLQRTCINLEHAYENLELREELTRIRHYRELLGPS